jgi:hypothetical protein
MLPTVIYIYTSSISKYLLSLIFIPILFVLLKKNHVRRAAQSLPLTTASRPRPGTRSTRQVATSRAEPDVAMAWTTPRPASPSDPERLVDALAPTALYTSMNSRNVTAAGRTRQSSVGMRNVATDALGLAASGTARCSTPLSNPSVAISSWWP